jgi:flagellar P-ring protein FlgI
MDADRKFSADTSHLARIPWHSHSWLCAPVESLLQLLFPPSRGFSRTASTCPSIHRRNLLRDSRRRAVLANANPPMVSSRSALPKNATPSAFFRRLFTRTQERISSALLGAGASLPRASKGPARRQLLHNVLRGAHAAFAFFRSLFFPAACLTAALLVQCHPLRAAANLPVAVGPSATHVARLKDITSVEGIRENQVIGYGLVVGLAGTGDKQQTIFSVQTLGNMLQRMGVSIQNQIATIQVRNIAAVFVTASLPAFARPGVKIDVTVSSIGDAKSLAGGTLLITPLSASDGKVYAVAQGPLIIGGYSAGSAANAKVVNHPTVGRIPFGALVERDSSVNLAQFTSLSLLLRDPDFEAARELAAVVNRELGGNAARVVDSRRIEIADLEAVGGDVPALLARIGDLAIHTKPPAKVVVNERTGTVVMGGNVTISACAILHGNLSIQVTTEFQVSQPAPFSKTGQTEVVPQTTVQAQESPLQVVQLKEGATVEELVRGLQTLGASARDVVAILQAIKAAGALNSDLEVL